MRLRTAAGIGLAMWVFAFGVYASTASPDLHGYDPQAANTAQGFLDTGHFEFTDKPLYDTPPDPGKDGKRVSRIGLPQALFMVPFYAAGRGLADAFPRSTAVEPLDRLTLAFYEPFIAATAAALFALILLRVRRSVGWAVVGGVLFTVASIAWPYSKIGMETTVMLGMVMTLAGVVYARVNNAWPWVVAGCGAGIAVAGKAYEGIAVVLLLTPLLPLLRSADSARRRRLLAFLLAPVLVWAAAVAWYNWSRFGSPLDFGQAEFAPTLSAPLSVAGFFISPGKGLLWYSPLILLGILGVKQLAIQDRHLARAIVGAVIAGVLVVAINTYWSDETWGPRYLVPVAWLLLIPIPFWAVTRRRQSVLAAVAAIAVAVQLVGVIAPYEAGSKLPRDVLGYDPLSGWWGRPPTPLGHDAQRWVPQLSPLVMQGALVASWAGTSVHLAPIRYTYHPYAGRSGSVLLTNRLATNLGVPDFWWLPRYNGSLGTAALLPALAMLLAALALTRAALGDGQAGPAWMRRDIRRRAPVAR
jgi:hypothetical protein